MKEARTESGAYQVTLDQQQRAKEIIENMDRQLAIEESMIDLSPKRRHFTYKAQLTYWKSAARISLLKQGWDDPRAIREYLGQVDRVKNIYIKSIDATGSYSNREELNLEGPDVEQRINDLGIEMLQLISRIEELKTQSSDRSDPSGD